MQIRDAIPESAPIAALGLTLPLAWWRLSCASAPRSE
jgi:hypothetical protein